MRVKFWGTRGSLPAPLGAESVREKIAAALVAASGRAFGNRDAALAFIDRELRFDQRATYGGNSACVEISAGSDRLLLDLGSGAREFAQAAHNSDAGPQQYDVLMSHPHWDHIMGFPFFLPAFAAGNRIRIHGCHADLGDSFRRQNAAPNFPVEFETLAAEIEFVQLEPGRRYEIGGFVVTPHKQQHPGDSYGYRIERGGCSLVYSTDSEYAPADAVQAAGFVEFIRGAELVIFDAMYSHADLGQHRDWGHSSNVIGVELCSRADVPHLCLFHHDPDATDAKLEQILQQTRSLRATWTGEPLARVSSAYDGLEIEI